MSRPKKVWSSHYLFIELSLCVLEPLIEAKNYPFHLDGRPFFRNHELLLLLL